MKLLLKDRDAEEAEELEEDDGGQALRPMGMTDGWAWPVISRVEVGPAARAPLLMVLVHRVDGPSDSHGQGGGMP